MNFNGLFRDTSQPMVRFPEGPREPEGMAQARTSGDDLEVAFSRIREEMRLGARMVFRMVIRGKSRALDPMIRDEAYRIGREALLNAFRHSEAGRVEIDLEYAPKQLRIAVRDNGKGITPETLRSGIGHRGLSGIRDVAERMGAKLKLSSRAEAGTEVELSIPAHIAFATNNRRLESAPV